LVQGNHWAWIWIAIGLQWLAFGVPAFLHLPPDVPTGLGLAAAAKRGFGQTLATVRDVWGMRDLRRFLIAFFVYMDGVITVIYFAARYAVQTLHFDTIGVIGMLAIVQVTALLGAAAMGRPTDRMGPRWTVRILLVWWVGVVLAAYFAESQGFFLVVAGLAGLGLGSIQAASRVFLARLIPAGRESEMFGFYALCGKTGSILGPATFGVVTLLTDGDQRPALLAVAAFYLIGLLLLRNVSDRPVA
jgi:UMF1 family MFS transporter